MGFRWLKTAGRLSIFGLGLLAAAGPLEAAENDTTPQDNSARDYKLAPTGNENLPPSPSPAAVPAPAPAVTEFETVDIFGEMEGTENDSEVPEEGAEEGEGEEGVGNEVPQVEEPEQKTSFPGLTDEELERRFLNDPQGLGSLSIGSPGGGRLRNGVTMPPGPNWVVVNPREAIGTSETIEAMTLALTRVRELNAKVPTLRVGDFSRDVGGYFPPHRSHQNGRDVDIGFYYVGGGPQRGRGGIPQNMDLENCWNLLRSLIVFTDIELILVDRRIQQNLYDYALSIGEDSAWLDTLFASRSHTAHSLIQHARGHRNHFHLRFRNAKAEELGRRIYPILVKNKAQEEANRPAFVWVKVRNKDTIGRLAKRYGSSASAIREANKLAKGSALRAGVSYMVPSRHARLAIRQPIGPLRIPARHLPPYTPQRLAAIDWGAPVSTRLAANDAPPSAETPQQVQEAPSPRHSAKAEERADKDEDAKAPTVARLAGGKNGEAGKVTRREAAKAAKKSKGGAHQDEATNYRVRPGDSLWTIARHHHVEIADLRRWNRLSRDKLALGQTLLIYPPAAIRQR